MTTSTQGKFSNGNSNSSSSNNTPFISPALSLENIKYFLEGYKTINSMNLISDKFKECPLYTKESQVPDSLFMVNKPFDRNSAFFMNHRPYGSYYRNGNSYKINKNYYPKYPIILSPRCELVEKLNEKEKKEKNSIKWGEKDFMMNDLANKVWTLKLFNDESGISSQFGPYSSKVVFQFLKSYYIPMNQTEQKKMNLLITDIIYDVYYQPESLYQSLQEEFKQN